MTDSPCGPVDMVRPCTDTAAALVVPTDPDEPEVVAELHTSGLDGLPDPPHPGEIGGKARHCSRCPHEHAHADWRLLGLMFDAYERADCFE